MPRTTIRAINEAIAPHGVFLAKGPGYFYFMGAAGAPAGIEGYLPSVYTTRLTDLSLDDWVAHVEDGVARYKAEVTP